jgi:hypothetical protein
LSWRWVAPRRCGIPTAAIAAACENGVEHPETCIAGGQPPARRRSGPQVFGYGRLGSGIVFALRTHHAPAIGIGLRAELDTVAVDVSVLNFALAFDPYERATDMAVGSRFKLSALRFITPDANRSAWCPSGSAGSGIADTTAVTTRVRGSRSGRDVSAGGQRRPMREGRRQGMRMRR